MTAQRREVVSSDYDPLWPRLYETECARIKALAPNAVLSMHHIGSTSVTGLAAKPIIDLLVILRRFLNEAEIAAVCAAGHEYRGIDDDIQRQYFSKRTAQAFHIHCYLSGNREAARFLLFRDYLRAHPEAAHAYEAVKRDLASRYRFERQAYQDAKTDFVRSVETAAKGLNPPAD